MRLLPLIAVIALASACPIAYSQGAGSYRKVFQKCNLTIAGKATTFAYRWMYGDNHGGTIFVDNYDTGDRYIVDGKDWTTVGCMGDGKMRVSRTFLVL